MADITQITPENIDQRAAALLLREIETIGEAVRQSRFYRHASATLILWGGLCACGYLVTFYTPRHAVFAWGCVWFAGIFSSIAISAYYRSRGQKKQQTLASSVDWRLFSAFGLFLAFGFFCVGPLGHFGPREISVFWLIYFMLAYGVAGLWVGAAFVVIGLGVSFCAITAYFWSGAWFNLWMAAINGGGLVIGGLWMRRS